MAQAAARKSPISGTALKDVRNVDAESGGEIVLMILLLREDFAELLSEGVVTDGLGLLNALTIIPDGFGFVLEVEADHILDRKSVV